MAGEARSTVPPLRRQLAIYGLLWCLGLYLRLAILIVPPLVPRLEGQLGFSSGEVAVATSLPLVALAFGALLAGWWLSRIGVITCVLWGLAIMALASAGRALPESYPPFIVATAVMGIGIAFLQTAMPVLSRGWLPGAVGRASAVYTNGLLVGELVAAGGTGLLVDLVLGAGWQWAFAIWVLPVPLLMVLTAWLGRAWREVDGAAGGGFVLPDIRSRRMWSLAALLGSVGALYFCGNVFLPGILGQTDDTDLLAVSLVSLNAAQIVSSTLLVYWADSLLGNRHVLAGGILLSLATIAIMLVVPGAGVVWTAAAFGFVTSGLLILVLGLPPWLESVATLPRTMSGMLFFGYVLVFAVTGVGGAINDITGSIGAAFIPLAVLSAVAMLAAHRLLQRVPVASTV